MYLKFIPSLFLLINILSSQAIAQEQRAGFDTNQLAEDLKSMSLGLEKSLRFNRAQLPVFNVVKDFGAINTGLKITTRQIQNAIDNCSRLGQGRIFFPAGIY